MCIVLHYLALADTARAYGELVEECVLPAYGLCTLFYRFYTIVCVSLQGRERCESYAVYTMYINNNNVRLQIQCNKILCIY